MTKEPNESEGDYALRVAVAGNNELYGKGSLLAEEANNGALGRIALQEALGQLRRTPDRLHDFEHMRFADDLDERTRDRLISHTREDVATALAHAASAFRAARKAKEIAQRTRWLIWFLIVLVTVLVIQGFLILAAVT